MLGTKSMCNERVDQKQAWMCGICVIGYASKPGHIVHYVTGIFY
jgi:hypothetical protein